jgi:hypothetical protein
MALHAKLSASSSHRWLNCLGSIKAEEGYKDKGSIYAAEGTTAHALAEMKLNGRDIHELIGQEVEGFPVSKEMVNNVLSYVDYVQSIGGEQFYEVRVDFSNVVPEGFGTSDAIAIVGKTIHYIDLNYGQGEKVDAEENSQGMLYAIGALNDYGFIYEIESIVIHIFQPRINNFSSWELGVEQLTKWADWVTERAKIVLSDNPPRSASDKACKFCKAKHECTALHDYVTRMIGSDFDDLTQPEVVPADELRRIMENKKLILGWLDAIESSITDKLKNGEVVDGFKLVNGRSSRKWIDDEDTISATLSEFLTEDEIYKKTILSPAQAEKLLGKKNATAIVDLVIKSEGAPTLAFESDSRKLINEKVVDDFDKI